MAIGFQNIFWGLFVVSFHINLGVVPVLPAFLGYMIWMHGVTMMREKYACSFLDRAYQVAILLVVIGLFGLYFTFRGEQTGWMIFYPVVYAVLEMLFFYCLLQGAITYFQTTGRELLAVAYRNKLSCYLVLSILFAILLCVSIVLMNVTLTWITAATGVAIRIWLMFLSSRIKKGEEMYEEEHREIKTL